MPRPPQPSFPGARLRRWRKTHMPSAGPGTKPMRFQFRPRLRYCYTQRELARWLGVTERTVQRWETGRVPAAILRRCAEACP